MAGSTAVTYAAGRSVAALLPWQQRPPLVDTTLALRLSKKETSVSLMKIEALCFLNKYEGWTNIFTDASKLFDGGVAAAFYVQNKKHADSWRMEDSTVIYSAELAAIHLAVNWLLEQDAPTTAVILSDSLSALNSLSAQRSTTHPIAMTRLLDSITKLEGKTVFAWIPGHVGVIGNEFVDRFAKQATEGGKVELFAPREIKDEYLQIDNHIQSIWQREYSARNKGAAYRALEPEVSDKLKYTNQICRKETMITRLRLGKCSLKKYLHDIRAHPDGLCSSCQVPETIEHLLLECASSRIPTKLRTKCMFLNLQPSTITILNTQELQDLVFDLVLEHNINL